MTNPLFWILARATGITAYALLTTSVLAGLLLKARPFGNKLKPAAVTDTHRFLALLGLTATGLHGISLVLDSKLPLPIKALFVPGASHYRPIPVSLGVVAAELTLVVYASFSLRKLIGTKRWRRLHWVTYGLFAAVTAHGVLSGSDSGHSWVISIYVSAVGSVVAATAWRTLIPPARRPRLERANTLQPVRAESSETVDRAA
jgi:methionine sulfoxide reductase heme-binding subunit